MRSRLIAFFIPALIITLPLTLGACGKDSSGSGKTGTGETLYVTAVKGLNLRAEPSVHSVRVGGLSNGAKVTVLERQPKSVTIGGKSGKWTKIKSSGGTGWVFGAFLGKEKPAKPPAQIILSGIFESDCDPDATMEFKAGGEEVVVSVNHCEGYEKETWKYTLKGTNLTLGSTKSAEHFIVRSNKKLEYNPAEYSLITCGNCKRGHFWKKK